MKAMKTQFFSSIKKASREEKGEQSYLHASRASDLQHSRDRFWYRILEIFPGFLSWGTLALAIICSWLFPAPTAFFLLIFILYWLFRVLYFFFHLLAGYRKTKTHEKINWLKKLECLDVRDYTLQVAHWRDLYHLIVIPTAEEPYEILKETIAALQQTDYPKDRMIVVLAIEQRVGETARRKAQALKQKFGNSFAHFLVTEHPKDLPGEIAGKGANETWGTKIAQKEIIDAQEIPHEYVILTSLDADTVVLPGYLSCLTFHYVTTPNPTRNSYQPVPLFMNNIWNAPAISRLFAFSTTFWFIMNQQRPEKMSTFASHSMSLRALVDVGYKQVNFAVDDSRIFWQCFLHYNGDYGVQPLHYPVSMDANAAPTLLATVRNIYKQQRRWAYGVADVSYFLFGFCKKSEIPLRKKLSLSFDRIEAYWSWAVASPIMFFLGWLPLVLGGEEFRQTVLSYNLPRYTSFMLTFTLLGLVCSAYLAILVLPQRPMAVGRWKFLWLVGQWFVLPVIMVFFALPALDAQTRLLLGKYMGFWVTPKFRKNKK